MVVVVAEMTGAASAIVHRVAADMKAAVILPVAALAGAVRAAATANLFLP